MKRAFWSGFWILSALLLCLLAGCTPSSTQTPPQVSANTTAATPTTASVTTQIPQTTESAEPSAEVTGAWESYVPNETDEDHTKRY
ncbi:MAG: hypothetical protein IJX28_00270 [Clostridia bacterium]|nr:hypothetical protein [Clostridia bacterium]